MKLFVRLALMSLLLLALVACGGSEENAVGQGTESGTQDLESAAAGSTDVGPESATAGQTVEAEQEAAVEEKAESPSVNEEGELAQPTGGEPEDDNQDVAAADEQDSAAGETAADEGEMAGEAGESQGSSGGAWGESGTTAQSACDHPYLPLREGATWTFTTGDEEISWEVVDLQGDLQQATAVVLVQVGDNELQYTWDCTADQGISSFDFASQGMANSFPDITIEKASAEGVFLPPAADMVPGYSWHSTYEQTAKIVIGEGDQQLETTTEMTTEQSNTILSADPVTAAGVTVDGVQVEQISDIVMKMDVMGTAVEQPLELASRMDLGWGIGITHQEIESEFGPSTMDLVSYFVP